MKFVINNFVNKENFYLNALISKYLLKTTKDHSDCEESFINKHISWNKQFLKGKQRG